MRARALIFPLTVLTLGTIGAGSLHETGGPSGQLIAFDSFREPDAMTCEWEVATPDRPPSTLQGFSAPAAQFVQRRGGGGARPPA